MDAEMAPLYLATIEDLGPGDFVKIDCAACGHTALLTAESLLRLGRGNREKVLDLKDRVRCRRCGVRGRTVVSIKWAKEVRERRAAQRNVAGQHHCSKDGDPDLLPEFEFVTVNRGRASAYMRDMEPTLEQMARSLVESGDY